MRRANVSLQILARMQVSLHFDFYDRLWKVKFCVEASAQEKVLPLHWDQRRPKRETSDQDEKPKQEQRSPGIAKSQFWMGFSKEI